MGVKTKGNKRVIETGAVRQKSGYPGFHLTLQPHRYRKAAFEVEGVHVMSICLMTLVSLLFSTSNVSLKGILLLIDAGMVAPPIKKSISTYIHKML